MRKIILPDELAEHLERLLTNEMDDEFLYQTSQPEPDTAYYEKTLAVYKAVLGKPTDFMKAFVKEDLLKIRNDQLALMKGAH